LPNPITRGNAVSTNTPTAYSDSTSQRAQISLLCQIPMSKRSRINSTLAPERYSATELLVRFSSTPELSPLHFAVEWAWTNLKYRRPCQASKEIEAFGAWKRQLRGRGTSAKRGHFRSAAHLGEVGARRDRVATSRLYCSEFLGYLARSTR
jgi:hypothetical protein